MSEVDLLEIEKSVACAYVWWKGLDEEIEKLVSNCRTCQYIRPEPKHEPVHCWTPPRNVFERVHVDYAGPFMGHFFFVLVDAYSKWPEVRIVPDMTTATTIKVCKNIFSTFGTPRILVSDHGTQFKSKEFEEFLRINGIVHKLGAPYHPATNGQAERFVQTMKNKLYAAQGNKNSLADDLDKILLAYRRAIHPVTNKSPAMVMFGRQIQTRLDLLIPKSDILESSERVKTKKSFMKGAKVAVRDYLGKDRWKFGVVVGRSGDLHYEVRLEDGRQWRRHVDQMRAVGEDVVDIRVEGKQDCTPVVSNQQKVVDEAANISQQQNSNEVQQTDDGSPTSPERQPGVTDIPAEHSVVSTESSCAPDLASSMGTSDDKVVPANLDSSRPTRNRKPPKHFQDFNLDF